MGRNNQRRRADKKRQHQDAPGRRPADPSPQGASPGPDLDLLVFEGVEAAANGARADLDQICTVLVVCSAQVGRAMVTDAMASLLGRCLAGAWVRGWQPAEVVHQVRRRRRGRHGDLATVPMAMADSYPGADLTAMPDAWRAQLQSLGIGEMIPPQSDWIGSWIVTEGLDLLIAFDVILETIAVVATLPVIKPVAPPPPEWVTAGPDLGHLSPDDPILAKIRALLAKAESTGFEAESEALTAKAQELMARHAIDDALARAGRPTEERPVTRRLVVDDPYALAKSHLLRVVAGANGVATIWHEAFAMMTVVGFASDLDSVDVLFTSLLVQASRAMLAKGSVSDGRGRSRTRSFRQSFILAFGDRIHERLVAAAASARHQAEEELSTSLLPVLASRDREVDDAVAALFPHLKRAAGPRITNEAGWAAGRTAAELATLGPNVDALAGTRSD